MRYLLLSYMPLIAKKSNFLACWLSGERSLSIGLLGFWPNNKINTHDIKLCVNQNTEY